MRRNPSQRPSGEWRGTRSTSPAAMPFRHLWLGEVGPGMASVVYQDDYYCDQTHLAPEERVKTNYDHPDAFDWPLMVQHMQALRRGEAIDMPTFDFVTHNRAPSTVVVPPLWRFRS